MDWQACHTAFPPALPDSCNLLLDAHALPNLPAVQDAQVAMAYGPQTAGTSTWGHAWAALARCHELQSVCPYLSCSFCRTEGALNDVLPSLVE